jgi:hypothetical protein
MRRISLEIDRHKFLWIAHGQHLEANRIDELEDGRVRPDPSASDNTVSLSLRLCLSCRTRSLKFYGNGSAETLGTERSPQ